MNKNFVTALALMIIATALYRVIPGRPYGFAPQIAVALFAGAIFRSNKKTAFLLPILSMLISDIFYQLLYINGLSEIAGFYSGQWENYLLFSAVTCVGFIIKNNKIATIAGASILGPTAFFLVSNSLVWLSGGGYQRSLNFSGWLTCLSDGLPFYQYSVLSTVVFSAIFFGVFSLLNKTVLNNNNNIA